MMPTASSFDYAQDDKGRFRPKISNYSMIITVHKQEPYKSFVISSQKTVEGRLNRGKFAKLQVGDYIQLLPEKILFEVVGKKVYPNFKTMIKAEGLANTIPDKKTISEAVKVYYQYYTKAEEKEFGVVAIRVKRVK
jgi:ASC-1-like (ASCH) protein